MTLTRDAARDVILSYARDGLAARGLSMSSVPDSFDLLREGVIDSFGFLELVLLLEEQVGAPIDFASLEPEELTVVGSLASFVAGQSVEQATT
jgi:acyl carrier protein